jgi:tetratricopeptide (TPR) repeat protein
LEASLAEDPKATGAVPGPPREEQDTLFRLQVNATEFVLKNGKYAAYALGLGLVLVLGYGLWDNWRDSRAEKDFAAIAQLDYKMPKPSGMAMYGLAPADDPADAARMADLEEGARRYRVVAEEASGTAIAVARLRAADAWERAGKADEALADLEAAWKLGRTDLPGFAVASSYARLLQDAERTEEALARLREEAGREQGVFAEEALLLLAEAQADAGKPDEAKNVLAELQSRFPDSTRAARRLALQARVGG